MEEYHIDGFRYDHVNGYLDRMPIIRNGKIDWYSHENRPNFTSLQHLSNSTYPEDRLLVYRRWKENQIIIVAINFSDVERHAPIPFGHAGTWKDVLDAAYKNPPFTINIANASTHESIPIPSNLRRKRNSLLEFQEYHYNSVMASSSFSFKPLPI